MSTRATSEIDRGLNFFALMISKCVPSFMVCQKVHDFSDMWRTKLMQKNLF